MATRIAHWKLDQATGAVVDESGNHDGANGGCTRGVGGKFNDCFSFDGIDDKVTVPDDPALNFIDGQAFSVATWIKTGEANDHDGIISKYTAGAFYLLQQVKTTGQIKWFIRDAALNSPTVTSPLGYIDDVWHHIVGTFDGTDTVELFIDKDSKGTGVQAVEAINPAIDLYFGVRAPGVRLFKGLIDEVWIFSGELTQEEIDNLYDYNSLSPPAGGGSPPTAGSSCGVNTGGT